MKRFTIITLAVLLLLGLTVPVLAEGPTGDVAVIQKAADAYLSSGKAPVISADQLFEVLNDGDPDNDPFILSVRKPEHYAKGHIPGAVNIFWKNVAEKENLAKLPKDRQIVVYCYTGHTGQIAATVLNLLGYDAVNLKFGIMGWTKNDEVLGLKRFDPATQPDYRVETEPHEATATYDFPTLSTGGADDWEIIRLAADNWLKNAQAPVMSADALWENMNDGDASNDYFVVSVRKPEHYAKGHIPGAINIPWRDIAKVENLAKLPPDKPLAVYCYTGHTGQVATTILGLMGYDAHNVKFGIMGWTKNDEVLGLERFDPATQPDYRVEAEAVAAPAELPTTGGFVFWPALAALGAAAVGAGVALRRK
ncbi:MAG: rhodanese-like domain-containing protein [Anaerolineae bacterium]|nr:rhodanese-like domain-containing protein [Anaerolineae bacterium]